MEKYKIYQSKLIEKNHQEFVNQCYKSYEILNNRLNTTSTTWSYKEYNIFSVTSSSILFYNLYKELNYHIRSFIGNNRPLWIQSWLNYHKGSEIEKELPFHSHANEYHGYISINPQDTSTIFKNGLRINNKIGQIYIGPGRAGSLNEDWDHCVKVNKPYKDIRITIGFDIHCDINKFLNPSFIPLL